MAPARGATLRSGPIVTKLRDPSPGIPVGGGSGGGKTKNPAPVSECGVWFSPTKYSYFMVILFRTRGTPAQADYGLV